VDRRGCFEVERGLELLSFLISEESSWPPDGVVVAAALGAVRAAGKSHPNQIAKRLYIS